VAARAVGHWPAVDVPASRGRDGSLRSWLSRRRSGGSPCARRSRASLGLPCAGDESVDELRDLAARADCHPEPAATWDDIFFQVFLDRVEPHLGRERPTFVFDWPLPLAALARRKPTIH